MKANEIFFVPKADIKITLKSQPRPSQLEHDKHILCVARTVRLFTTLTMENFYARIYDNFPKSDLLEIESIFLLASIQLGKMFVFMERLDCINKSIQEI